MEQADPAPPQTEPSQIFGWQMDNIMYLLRIILRDIEDTNKPIESLQKHLDATGGTLRNIKASLPTIGRSESSVQDAIKDGLVELNTHSDRLEQGTNLATLQIAAFLRTHPFLYDWMLVMIVTFAEAYLEGALHLLARSNPGIMAVSTMLLTGADVMDIDPTPEPAQRWESLLQVMRHRWAVQLLREKPTQWISRLEKFGVPSYPKDLASRLTDVWKARNSVVHRRPSEFSPAPVISKAATERFMQSKARFIEATTAICDFIDRTDLFVARRMNTETVAP
jgi:hypothetical protein